MDDIGTELVGNRIMYDESIQDEDQWVDTECGGVHARVSKSGINV